MFFCLRVDLDYVPWDTPDAQDFGHGEPAAVLRLLDLARSKGLKLHFFASGRVLRAFPSACDTILNEGHDLDWLCKHPFEFHARLEQAATEFRRMGASLEGFATREAWPEVDVAAALKFISAPPGAAPAGMRHFPVLTRPDREAARAGLSARSWLDSVRTSLREQASLHRSVTVAIRPQVLALIDPRLHSVKELVELAQTLTYKQRTLREALSLEGPAAP